MRFVPMIIALLGFGMLVPSSPEPAPVEATLAKIAVAHPDWDLTDIAKRSPACDCQDKCQCAEPCLCNVVDEKPNPLTVGKPPEHTLDDAKPSITPAEATSLVIVGPQPKEPCQYCKRRPCECVPEKEGRGPIPVDLGPHQRHTLQDGRQTWTFAEQEGFFTHPQPQVLPVAPPPKPQVLPVKPKAATVAATGHYEMRQQCGRGGCSMVRVWVPHSNGQPAAAPAVYQQSSCGSCGPGGCGRRGIFGGRGLFGRRR